MAKKQAHFVIVGNGVAAAGCIEGIRSVDRDTPITVISEENHPVYCRPLISYYLEGKTKLENMPYRPENFYAENGCTVLYGQKAASINPEKQTVLLEDGTSLPYTALCAATGSSPFVPPTKGYDTVEKKFTFLTLDDALALEQAVTPDSRVLIVGAGLIGLKCAEGLCHRVGHITVCDLASRILSSILDDDCAGMMQKALEEQGIDLLLGNTVSEFEKNRAIMQDGQAVEFDVLVMAVGVKANVSLVKDAGGQVNRGILVNDQMETSLQKVYAAGDCTEGLDVSSGEKRVLAILPNAYMQGHCAGVNMAGGKAEHTGAIPMNSLGLFGLHAMTAGSYFGPGQGGQLYEERSREKLKRLFTKDDRLTGFILIGPTERAGIYTALIREKTPMSSLNFDLLKQAITFSAFEAAERQKKFGGAV